MDEQVLKYKNFVLLVNEQGLKLFIREETSPNRSIDLGNVPISAAEVEKLIHLISMTKEFSTRKACPPYITSSPFRIFFEAGDADTVLKVFKRGGVKEDMVPFSFGDIESLIDLLNKGEASWKNVQQMSNSTGQRPSPVYSTPDPTFEGLN